MQIENSTVGVLWEVEPHLPPYGTCRLPLAAEHGGTRTELGKAIASLGTLDSKAAGIEPETMDNFSSWWQGQWQC